VKLRTGDETIADPLLGETESMGILADADGYLLVPEGVTEMKAGASVKVRLVAGFSGVL
jgi:molybdopterin biosynthesis enzyme